MGGVFLKVSHMTGQHLGREGEGEKGTNRGQEEGREGGMGGMNSTTEKHVKSEMCF
jgi:hypothetical protein